VAAGMVFYLAVGIVGAQVLAWLGSRLRAR
jgi:hypothetical protein